MAPEPEPGVDKRYYCGFAAGAASGLQPTGDTFAVELVQRAEHGVDAHVAIVVRPTTERKLKGGDLTEVGRLLALAFTEVAPHICPAQAADKLHPIARWGAGCLRDA